MNRAFTEEDIEINWFYHKEYLVEILNGDYDLDEAREDLAGLIDGRQPNPPIK